MSQVQVVKLSINEIATLVDHNRPLCHCGKRLRGIHLRYHQHDGGYIIHEEKDPQRIYTHCPNCGYDFPLKGLMAQLD